MKIVIGLVGEKGGGKGTFTNLLREIATGKSIGCKRSGDVLLETLKIWNITPNRTNLQKLAVIMDKTYGAGALTGAVQKRIIEDPSDITVFDGVRWTSDAQMIRQFSPNFLIYITADARTRYERTKLRKEKAGEENASFEQFLKEEKAETEIFISRIGEAADVKINNNGSLEELKERVADFYENHIKTLQ